MLEPTTCKNHQNQGQIGDCANETVAQNLACRTGEVEAKAVHRRNRRSVSIRAGQIKKHLAVFVDIGRVERLEVRNHDFFGPITGENASNYLSSTVSYVGCPSSNAQDHPVEDQEDWDLEEKWKTTADRVDVVLLVELHHLDVHLFALVFVVLVLNCLELRLKELHLEHGSGAGQCQRRRDNQHTKCQQNDRDRIGVAQVIEKRKQASDKIEHQFAFRTGTGSAPCPPQGWHRQIRVRPSQEPLITPKSSMASSV